MNTNVLFIIVLYRVKLEASLAYQSLTKIFGNQTDTHIYVHDNTDNNIKLAQAYNLGVDYAATHHKQWIILLDQDTEVTQTYIDVAQHFLSNPTTQVAVPILTNAAGKQLSPFYYDKNQGPFLRQSFTKRPNWVITAFNSGTIIHIDAIKKIGYFNEDYPLDYLDYDYFLQFDKHNIAVTPLNAILIHHLSVDTRNQITHERYASILKAELSFAKQLGSKALFYYHLCLLGRSVKWIFKHPTLVGQTIQHLAQR